MFIKVTNKSKPQRVTVRVVKQQQVGHRATIGHSLFIDPAKLAQFNKLTGRA